MTEICKFLSFKFLISLLNILIANTIHMKRTTKKISFNRKTINKNTAKIHQAITAKQK